MKRKDNWVKRFAFIDGPSRTFKYKNYFGDKEFKFELNLAKEDNVIIKKGMRNFNQPYFTIKKSDDKKNMMKKNKDKDTIRVSFDS